MANLIPVSKVVVFNTIAKLPEEANDIRKELLTIIANALEKEKETRIYNSNIHMTQDQLQRLLS